LSRRTGIIGVMDTPVGSAPVETLLENHRAFLRYLERRVGDRALAEDILQDAFAKVVARPERAPADESSFRGSTARYGTRRSISFGVVELLIVRSRPSHVSLKRTKHPRTTWRRRSAPACLDLPPL
jgi:hypothetical protein